VDGGDSWKASSRLARMVGSRTTTSSAAATRSSARLKGWVTNTVGSPRLMIIARRRFSSSIGPSTKPSSSGAGSKSSLTSA
jgi:hypothetical protein